ncbi:MAG: GNAT family N-acetyltransferase [Verrucomicrobiota bacterium]
MIKYSIRRAAASDATELLKLNLEFNKIETPIGHIVSSLSRIDNPETIFVAYSESGLMGFACLQITQSFCYAKPNAQITELFVQPLHRQKGIASQLIRAAEDFLQERNAEELTVLTRKGNKPALAFYRKHDFKKEDELCMRKLIA